MNPQRHLRSGSFLLAISTLLPLPATADIWKCQDGANKIVFKTEKCEDIGLRTIEMEWQEKPRPRKKANKRETKPSLPIIVRDEEAIFRRVAASMLLIKRNLRDPDSVVWEYAGATTKGDTICISYRAKNGFGGYNRENFVVNDRGGTASLLSWNRACAGKTLKDFTYAKFAVP